MSLTTTLLSGAVGGLLATLGAKGFWRFLTRPELEFDSGIIKNGASHPVEMMAWGKYKVEISNTGRSVASNCKPKIRFVGFRETTEKSAKEPPEGYEVVEQSVHERYVIDLTLSWDESDSPSRIDLNREESAQFELFSVHSESDPPNGADTKIQFGTKKKRDEIEKTGEVWKSKPVRIESSYQGDFSRPIVQSVPTLDKEVFEDIEWTEQSVQVTSADTTKISRSLNIYWDDVIPEVSI